MSGLQEQIVVSDIAGERAAVKCENPRLKAQLALLGFVQKNDYLQRSISDVDERVSLINALIQLGALFSAGPDWSPSEVVAFFKDQGLVTSGYREIAWTGPDQYRISTIN